MIYPAKYNGINFSSDFTRESPIYNFDNQRKLNIVPVNSDIKYLSFFWRDTEVPTVSFSIISELSIIDVPVDSSVELVDGTIFYFKIITETMDFNVKNYIKLQINEDIIYSEYFKTKSISYLAENEICHIIASNNDDRHGYLSKQAFGFFKFSKFKYDIFLNKKTEYEYSYSRKKILKSENQIGKRFIFHDLTMYQQNLLKWLCNCENLSIDGVDYELISDFTEIESDPNSEIMSLQADFVEVNQSFFSDGSVNLAKNVFQNEFFMK